MSSSLRSYKNGSSGAMISWVNGPCMLVEQNEYEPPEGVGIGGGGGGAPINLLFQNLIPFVYSNQVLDILVDAPYNITFGPAVTFRETMMTSIGGVSLPHFPTYFNYPTSSQVKMLGGQHIVTEIGAGFREYIQILYGSAYSAPTDIRVYSPGIVTKVKILDMSSLGTWLGIINPNAGVQLSGDSTVAPVSDYSVGGDSGTTYVFLQPITIAVTTVNDGVHYFTLKSQISSSGPV